MNLMYYLFSVSVASQHCIKEETQQQSLISKEMQLEVCLCFLLLSIHWQFFISLFPLSIQECSVFQWALKQCQTEMNCCNLRESNLYVREEENKQTKTRKRKHKDKNGLGNPSWIVKSCCYTLMQSIRWASLRLTQKQRTHWQWEAKLFKFLLLKATTCYCRSAKDKQNKHFS